MSEITNQRIGELIAGSLSILKDQSDGMTWRDLVYRLEQLVPATSFEHSSRPVPVPLRRYEMIARFCCERAAKAGWISKQRDIWTVTDSGRQAYANLTDSKELGEEATRLYHDWRRGSDTVDFFVSFTNPDKPWADWIAWNLDREGYSIRYQPWDFGAGTNFVLEMDKASRAARRIIAVLSADYLKSRFASPEWAAAFAQDPTGQNRALVPVLVRECDLAGTLFSQIVHIDLVAVDTEEAARRALLEGLGDFVPSERPDFPGPIPNGTPPFPGTVADPVHQRTKGNNSCEHSGFAAIQKLPPPGIRLAPSPPYSPPAFYGLRAYPEDPLAIDFLLEVRDGRPTPEDLEEMATRLTKYFLAALTIPERHQWVNLSPHEGNQIMEPDLAATVLGRDLLIQDYVLKQLTASLCYPERRLGKDFWDTVYEEQAVSVADSPEVNTFNKVWVLPESAEVVQDGSLVAIAHYHLKAMMEEDYVALSEGLKEKAESSEQVPRHIAKRINSATSKVYRKVLLPHIERDVNEGSNFAVLRQILNSMVLAVWYKAALRESALGELYVDKTMTDGVESEGMELVDKLYNQYMRAFEVGVFQYIKEEYDPRFREVIPKKYFSGGFTAESTHGVLQVNAGDPRETFAFSQIEHGDAYWVKVRLVPIGGGGWPNDTDPEDGGDRGGIDLDPGKGFQLNITRHSEISFMISEEMKEKLGAMREGGLRPVIKEIVLAD